MKKPKCPFRMRQKEKARYIYTHMHKYYLAIRKYKEILPSQTIQMDLEGSMLSEVRQKKTNTIHL